MSDIAFHQGKCIGVVQSILLRVLHTGCLADVHSLVLCALLPSSPRMEVTARALYVRVFAFHQDKCIGVRVFSILV